MSTGAFGKDRLRALGGLFSGAAMLLATGMLQHHLGRVASGDSAWVTPPPEYVGLSIDPLMVRRFLGVRLVVADWVWIDTLFKADLAHEAQPFTAFYRSFKTITELDPDHLSAYYVAGLYLSVIKDDIKGSTAILSDGVRYMESPSYEGPRWWALYFALGYNLMFEEHAFEEGGQWIQKASALPSAPAYVQELGRRVSTEAGQLQVGASILTDLYRRVSRPEEKKLIEGKMAEIAGRQQLAELNEKFQEFLSNTEAYALPKQKAFKIFMRTMNQPKKDMLGRVIGVDALGKIVPLGAER